MHHLQVILDPAEGHDVKALQGVTAEGVTHINSFTPELPLSFIYESNVTASGKAGIAIVGKLSGDKAVCIRVTAEAFETIAAAFRGRTEFENARAESAKRHH